MKRKAIIFWIWLFCASFFPFHLIADQIYLKDGRVLKGVLISDGDQYIIQMKYGKIKIKKSKVLRVEKDKEIIPVKEEPPPPKEVKPKKQEPTLTTDERIEKVVSQYTENLLKNLFEPKFHQSSLELLRDNPDCRLIPLIFQRMEQQRVRNVEISLLLSKQNIFRLLVQSIRKLPKKDQVPYEELFAKGMKSSNPFVRVLSIYGLKLMNSLLLTQAKTILEEYHYDSLYSHPHPKISYAHYLAREEILLLLVPLAKKLAQEHPQTVDQNLEKLVHLIGGLSPNLNENPAVLLLKKWEHPNTVPLILKNIEQSLKNLGETRFYNEDSKRNSIVLHPYGSHLLTYFEFLLRLPSPPETLKQLYPLVRLSYAQLYSKEVADVRKNLFYQTILKYTAYGKEDLSDDFVQFLSDFSKSLNGRFHFKEGTLEYKMLDFLLEYNLKNPKAIKKSFKRIINLQYLEEDILKRTDLLAKKFPQEFLGAEKILAEIALRSHLSSSIQKTTMQIIFRIHSKKAKEALLSLAEKGPPNVSVIATSFLKRWN